MIRRNFIMSRTWSLTRSVENSSVMGSCKWLRLLSDISDVFQAGVFVSRMARGSENRWHGRQASSYTLATMLENGLVQTAIALAGTARLRGAVHNGSSCILMQVRCAPASGAAIAVKREVSREAISPEY